MVGDLQPGVRVYVICTVLENGWLRLFPAVVSAKGGEWRRDMVNATIVFSQWFYAFSKQTVLLNQYNAFWAKNERARE